VTATAETALAPAPHAGLGHPGVNLYAPVGVASGLGTAARGYLAALRAAAVPLSLVPIHELFVHQLASGHHERRQRPRHAVSIAHVNADSVDRFLHFHRRSFARARYKIGLWVWELPALRDEFAAALRHFDEIWVPSRFCQRAVQAMTAKPVAVMPHVVSASQAPSSGWREKLGIRADQFAFLYMFDATSIVERKNPHCLLDAFASAFPDQDRMRLVLKVAHGEKDRTLSCQLDELSRRDRRLVVLRDMIPERELSGLVAACDCYVSPHRAEGFGLTVAEALARGVPVIATDFGGTADFVTDEVGYPLRHRLVELDRDYGPYPEGAIWADPSRQHLAELLRHIAANPDAAKAKAQRGRRRMIEDYSAAAVGHRLRERLAAIATDGSGDREGER
jgi:glycosyltransferase involved in cell wall biosynthesis